MRLISFLVVLMVLVVVMVTEQSIANLLTQEEGQSPGKSYLDGVGDAKNEGPRAESSDSPS